MMSDNPTSSDEMDQAFIIKDRKEQIGDKESDNKILGVPIAIRYGHQSNRMKIRERHDHLQSRKKRESWEMSRKIIYRRQMIFLLLFAGRVEFRWLMKHRLERFFKLQSDFTGDLIDFSHCSFTKFGQLRTEIFTQFQEFESNACLNRWTLIDGRIEIVDLIIRLNRFGHERQSS